MRIKRKKIQLIYTGGLDFPQQKLSEKRLIKWLKSMPELILLGEIKLKILLAETGLTGEVPAWQLLAGYIYRQIKHYDGFIVISELDKLQNQAVALSFMLAGLNKPIIFTTGLLEEAKPRPSTWRVTDNYGLLHLKTNIINSLQFINQGVPGVSLMFGNQLVRAVQAVKLSDNFNIFATTGPVLGRVGFNVIVNKHNQQTYPKKGLLKLQPNFDQRVVFLKIYSGFSSQTIEDLAVTKNGIIIDFDQQSFNGQDLARIKNNQKIVVLYNLPQAIVGRNFIRINHVLPHVLLIKLMWVLGQTKTFGQAKRLLLSNLTGEFFK